MRGDFSVLRRRPHKPTRLHYTAPLELAAATGYWGGGGGGEVIIAFSLCPIYNFWTSYRPFGISSIFLSVCPLSCPLSKNAIFKILICSFMYSCTLNPFSRKIFKPFFEF